MARNPDPFPTIRALSVIPVPRHPNSVTALISVIVIIIRRIVVIRWIGVIPINNRRGWIENEGRTDEKAKVEMAVMMSMPGRGWSGRQENNHQDNT
jgi:hypothetical protein